MKREIDVTFKVSRPFAAAIKTAHDLARSKRRHTGDEALAATRVIALDTSDFRRRGTPLACQTPTPYSSGRSTTAPILSCSRQIKPVRKRSDDLRLFRYLAIGVKTERDAAKAHRRLRRHVQAQEPKRRLTPRRD